MKKIFTLFTALLISNFLLAQIPTMGLMAYWNFDNNLIDTSANTHNLTALGTASYAPGIKGNAVKVGGATGYLHNSDNFIPTSSFTFSCWAKHPSSTGWSYPTIIELTQGLYMRFVGASFNNIEGGFYYATTGYASISNAAPIDTNWHHYVGIHDPANQNAYVYIDGVLVQTLAVGATLNVYGGLGGAYPCMVGGGSGGNQVNQQKQFDGLLDELLVYQTALSTTDVKAVYCDGFLTGPNFTNNSNTLTISAGNRDSIQWMLNGSAITGATSPSYTATVGGSYSVDVFSKVGCSKSSVPQGIVIGVPNGIDEMNAIHFDVAPNPTTNFITINSAVLNAQVNIYSIDGRTIYTDKIMGSKKSIDASSFQNGLYIIELKAEGKVSRTKFIKE